MIYYFRLRFFIRPLICSDNVGEYKGESWFVKDSPAS